MKKLIFLLLMAVALAGFVPAWDAAHPPGVLTLEAALFGDGADSRVVTPDTVLALAALGIAQPSSIQAAMADDSYTAIQPDSGIMPNMPLRFGQVGTDAVNADYYLRC